MKKDRMFKKIVKRIGALVLACSVMVGMTLPVYAEETYERETKSKYVYMDPGDGRMVISITAGETLAQGSISTNVVSDMYIKGYCKYVDIYGNVGQPSMESAREQVYSSGAFVSRSKTYFYYVQLQYEAYDNDGGSGKDTMSINLYS